MKSNLLLLSLLFIVSPALNAAPNLSNLQIQQLMGARTSDELNKAINLVDQLVMSSALCLAQVKMKQLPEACYQYIDMMFASRPTTLPRKSKYRAKLDQICGVAVDSMPDKELLLWSQRKIHIGRGCQSKLLARAKIARYKLKQVAPVQTIELPTHRIKSGTKFD